MLLYDAPIYKSIGLQCVTTLFSGPHAHHILDVGDKDLAVADARTRHYRADQDTHAVHRMRCGGVGEIL